MMPFDLTAATLKASGLSRSRDIALYVAKLHQLIKAFSIHKFGQPSQQSRAEALFQWLWHRRPHRYHPRAPFRLPQVIDAQLDDGQPAVGNCLGLTLLYNCLLEKMGIPAKAIYLEDALPQGPHVISYPIMDSTGVDVDHISSHGFDSQQYKSYPHRTLWDFRELVAEVYHSSGNSCFIQERLDQAAEYYAAALRYNPQHERVRLNQLILAQRREGEGADG